MKKLGCITVKLLFSLTVLAQEQKDLATLTTDLWREDITYFATQLPKRHKNAFHTTTQEQFDKAIADLNQELPSLKHYQIIVKLMQITASIGDGHTGLHLPSSFNRYPVNLFWYGDDLYVRATTAEYKQIVGTRVVKISGMPLAEVNKKLKSVISCYENKWYDMNVSAQFMILPEILNTLGIVPGMDRATFTFLDAQNKEIEMNLLPIPLSQKPVWVKASPADEPLYRQKMTEPFWFTFVEDINAVYVNWKNYEDLRKNATSLFDFVNQKKVSTLIVDMRQNGGGDYFKGRNLIIDPIKANTTINQKGNLYVIPGRATFSAAMVNTIDFKKETAAIIVGEPPGERPNSYSENDELKLPNSEIIVSYSTRYYKFLDQDVDAFEPDVRIDPDWASFIAGRDPVMDWIVQKKK